MYLFFEYEDLLPFTTLFKLTKPIQQPLHLILYDATFLESIYLILALPEMINESCTSLWVLASIKTIQFSCDKVQCLISIEELSQQRWIISLKEKIMYYNTIHTSAHPYTFLNHMLLELIKNAYKTLRMELRKTRRNTYFFSLFLKNVINNQIFNMNP
jgi:hypothetical protein